MALSAGERVGGGHPERSDVDLHEVRLDPVEVHGHARGHEALGERPGTGVVVGEPLDVMVERVHARSRDHARLAHGAAEEVLLAPGALHELPRAGDERPERAAEPLREAERDGVEARADRGRRHALRDGGVQEPRAVEVRGEPVLARRLEHVIELVERPDASAGVVVRVLERQDRCPLIRDLRARRGRGANLLGRDTARDARQAAHDEPRVRRRTPVLVHEDV